MRRRRLNDGEIGRLSQLCKGCIPMASLVHTLAVAEYLSFHRAAEALGTSQSSVSARVKALEETLGTVLFERNTRGVRLTDAGRRFVDQVENAMGILDHAVKTAGMKAPDSDGELHIGVHALISGGSIDRLLERFQRAHSLVHLNIAERTARDAQMMVRSGMMDIAFMACDYEIPDLHSRVIWRDRLMVALSVKHVLAARPCVDWRQLAEEMFLVRHGGTGPQVHDLIVSRFMGKYPHLKILRFDVSHSALLSMIAAGRGISICVEEETASAPPGLVFLPITDEPETVPFSAVWSPCNCCPLLKKLLNLATDMGRVKG